MSPLCTILSVLHPFRAPSFLCSILSRQRPFHTPSSPCTEEDSPCNIHAPSSLCTVLPMHCPLLAPFSPCPTHRRGFQAQFAPNAVFSTHCPPLAESSPRTGENSTSHLLHAPSSTRAVLPLHLRQLPSHQTLPCTTSPTHHPPLTPQSLLHWSLAPSSSAAAEPEPRAVRLHGKPSAEQRSPQSQRAPTPRGWLRCSQSLCHRSALTVVFALDLNRSIEQLVGRKQSQLPSLLIT